VRVAFRTCRGKTRDVNEDSVFLDQEMGLFIVADGMGGHPAGEIASSMAVAEISNSIRNRLSSGAEVPALLEESLRTAHKAILENSLEFPDRREMGTTVVVVLVRNDHVWFSHLGDSRAYLMSQGRIRRLTRDHTFVAEWVEAGLITGEEARVHQARHGLTMALGVDDEVHPETGELSWTDGQCVLLCSDGLTDVLEDRTLLQIVETSKDLEAACDALVTEAKSLGGGDDITVVLVCR
jgi:serine/threonine protein phosphatase PrpC